VALGALAWWTRNVSVGGLGALGDDFSAFTGVGKKSLVESSLPTAGPSFLPTAVAMFSALLLAIPVSWIYQLTRRKKGWKQSVIHTLLVLPVTVAGIVVLVKYSLPLAFGLSAIVAAVRFRSTLDDTKDASYMLVVIGIGLAAGVNPPVAAALSMGFNLLVVGLWFTDFGRASAALEGKFAERQLERALEHASRTGTFVARMDDEVFKSLAPDQLDAISDRAWRRRKRSAPEIASGEPDQRPVYSTLLRLRTAAPEQLRAAVEAHFGDLFARWRFGDVVHEEDGLHVVEYAVDFDPTVTPGVVSDRLREAAGSHLVRLEMR
jgi:Domain of unknown function (DUF4956)